ncbi:hypothetical protein PT502_08625 [Aliarcobacter butzleri]|uniref:capsular polysaccharide export protein, LipB/KpsS family n=1 Tax=Aliarcobacter butzleri TaxID=28197 RepID=UPI0024DE22F0|nr:hypothetical protein [Aliarcobacter butzleri]MDK2083865.1 hypothetical protein [Aliarcobacter butzleri]
MNICIYAFGSSSLFANEFIKKSLKKNKDFKFYIILESSHYIDLFENNKNIKILCINKEITSIIDEEINLNELKDYPSNIFKDIESEKKTLKSKKSDKQLQIAFARYKLIKSFLKNNDVNHILYIQHPENFNSILIENIARELMIDISVPIHTRNIDTSFFSNSCQEVLPNSKLITEENKKNAIEFLNTFKQQHISASINRKEPFNTLIDIKKDVFLKRVYKYFKRLKDEKENREFIIFYVAFVNNLPVYRDFIWRIRKYFAKKQYNLDSFEDLPKRYIYYPLQYSPESSINIPAPFYIDQMRIIDALRMNMPNDMKLVVKEHPSCAEVRALNFVKSLLKKSGVIVAKYDLDSRELIKRSSIVVSVSGTAAFEAFLLNKPSFVMSQTFFDSFIGGPKGLDNMKEIILEKIEEVITDEQIISALAHIFSVSKKFYGITAFGHGSVMMTKENIEIFFNEFLKHIEREK